MNDIESYDFAFKNNNIHDKWGLFLINSNERFFVPRSKWLNDMGDILYDTLLNIIIPLLWAQKQLKLKRNRHAENIDFHIFL